MATKRPRAAFEADLQAQQSPYVFYGTALPPLDANVRDDGSYVPIWKQEVTDDRGRKRLHGAFTGGFNAGYFNTVGSKEGWTPATFVSSRSNRWKDSGGKQQRPEDFMDDEDLAEAEEARQVSTKDAFSSLGSTEDEVSRRAPLMDLLRPSGETMGMKLLRKMGWRDGQGIGPKVWRKARLDEGEDKENGEQKHLFAPENSKMISFVRKNDHKGLGYQGKGRLSQPNVNKGAASDEDDEALSTKLKPKKKQAPRKGAFGVGVLNDTGSDDEDPYSMGPKISYNRVMGGDKKKKKTSSKPSAIAASNPLLNDRPIFVSKKLSKTNSGFRKCHDGRLPLDGFILSIRPSILQENKYPPPTIPIGWKSSKSASASTPNPSTDPSSSYQSTAALAKSTTLTPSTRGSLLGESALPGKSVFSFLKPDARARIADLTHNTSLPPAGSEVPNDPSSQPQDPTSLIPPLDPAIASTALGRGVAGFVPYSDNPAKLARYRAFLSYRAQLNPSTPAPAPDKPKQMSRDEWAAELNEFAHAATIFKPMAGSLASRFTTSSSTSTSKSDKPSEPGSKDKAERTDAPKSTKPADPAEEAAGLGMFGPLTRSAVYFYPSRLLCKRFDVAVPGHVNSANEGTRAAATGAGGGGAEKSGERRGGGGGGFESRFASRGWQTSEGQEGLLGREEVGGKEGDVDAVGGLVGGGAEAGNVVDPERNEALEGERPGEEVFRAIFGDSDSDSDSDSG